MVKIRILKVRENGKVIIGRMSYEPRNPLLVSRRGTATFKPVFPGDIKVILLDDSIIILDDKTLTTIAEGYWAEHVRKNAKRKAKGKGNVEGKGKGDGKEGRRRGGRRTEEKVEPPLELAVSELVRRLRKAGTRMPLVSPPSIIFFTPEPPEESFRDIKLPSVGRVTRRDAYDINL